MTLPTITIFDPADIRDQLLPITYTRPVGAIRMGILTMADRWQKLLPGDYYWQTQPYLNEIYPAAPAASDFFISGNVVATRPLAEAISKLGPDQRLLAGDTIVAYRGAGSTDVAYDGEVMAIRHIYEIFTLNGQVFDIDFDLVTSGRKSEPIDPSNTVIGDPAKIFMEEGADVVGASLNTRGGAIYIGRDASVMEGSHLRGPVALCEHAVANMGALIYGPTTLGPYCKVGGELNNVVMLGYSNKAHDGFLGNSVIGEWCNIGGGTVASNLKNDYTEIKLWNYPAQRFLRTGLQFCGLIMGDHSKTAINTSLNTATTIGVGCNIISEGMPRVFIPSFLKGGTAGFDNVNLTEFFQIATRVMARRGIALNDAHRHMFQSIFESADRFK